MITGFDFKGFASLVEREAGIPAFGFAAGGLHYYDRGQRDAYRVLAARRLSGESPRKVKGGVNIPGASALDGFDGAAPDAPEETLAAAGCARWAVRGARSSREAPEESAAAELNGVVSAAALPLARFFAEQCGTPFVAGLPVGQEERDRIRAALNACRDGGKPARPFPPAAGCADREPETIIIGEALFCSSFRACLEAGGASGPVGIGSFFSQGKEFLRPGDRLFAREDDARAARAAPRLKQVFADPLVAALIPRGARVRFTPLPHRPISGRLYNESLARFFAAPPRPEPASAGR
jgi:hypothetical protein